MVKSCGAALFAIQSGPSGRLVESKAVLTVTKAQGFKGKPGWRAVISLHGCKKRIFGTWNESFVEAVRALLETQGHKVSTSEQDRLLKLAQDMETRRTAASITNAANPGVVSTPALSQAPVDAHATSQEHGQQTAVKVVHQIYGLFGDGKPMSNLFETSHKKWKDLATRMSAHYHLWNAEEVEALIKQKYPQYWDMYEALRYPIMRVDIARLIILHAYGGMYADLDTMPNRVWSEKPCMHPQRALFPGSPIKTCTNTYIIYTKHQAAAGPALPQAQGRAGSGPARARPWALARPGRPPPGILYILCMYLYMF